MKREVTTPEATPSPTLKPEIRMDNEISPMKPLPPPTAQRQGFSYEEPAESQGSPKQRTLGQQEASQTKEEATEQLAPPTAAPPATSQPVFPLRTTSLDPPEPSPSVRPSTAPAPQSNFNTTHSSHSTTTVPTNLSEESETDFEEPPFVPLTKQAIPLRVNLIPRITASQLHCYTSHRTNIWSNNVFQPMGCMICHSNERDRKFSCTWCQLRICRDCSQELMMVPGRDLGRLLGAREGPRVLVEDVDQAEEQYEDESYEMEAYSEGVAEEERGRGMVKVDSRERTEAVTPRA